MLISLDIVNCYCGDDDAGGDDDDNWWFTAIAVMKYYIRWSWHWYGVDGEDGEDIYYVHYLSVLDVVCWIFPQVIYRLMSSSILSKQAVILAIRFTIWPLLQ